MAGAKGRSGGTREGAGRKPAKARKTKAKGYQTSDPDEFLRHVMKDAGADFKDRLAAALALKKSGKGGVPQGKRQQQSDDAQRVVQRSLAPAAAPTKARGHLRAVK